VAVNDGTGWQLDEPYRLAFSVSGTPVPEPSTLLLLALGTLGLVGWGRWRSKKIA
jgi:hypothetical protein